MFKTITVFIEVEICKVCTAFPCIHGIHCIVAHCTHVIEGSGLHGIAGLGMHDTDCSLNAVSQISTRCQKFHQNVINFRL